MPYALCPVVPHLSEKGYINHCVYKMCLLDNSLHFKVEIKAVLEGRGFRPTIFGNFRTVTD